MFLTVWSPRCLGQRLQASRDVDAVPIDALALGGHIAHVDADPEVHAALVGEARVERSEHPLGLDGAADRVEGGRKLGQQVVAGGVHDAPPVLSDAHRDVFAIVRQCADRGGLVLGHQPAVADHVSREDGGELAFNGFGGHAPPWRDNPDARSYANWDCG
jgi:hypothetical protein